MSLDACIAALPRIEKGVQRDSRNCRFHAHGKVGPRKNKNGDTANKLLTVLYTLFRDARLVFTPIPNCPTPYSLNLTQEYTRFSFSLEDQSNASVSSRPQQEQPQRQHQQQHQQLQQQQTPGFNCSVCRKSFGSEATWNNHQMSAKHIAAVKDMEKKNKAGSKGGSGQRGARGSSTNNNSGAKNKQQQPQRTNATQKEEYQDPPEVVEALTSFRKVEKVVKESPGMAAPVLWKIAKALWSHRQSLETARVLSLLIRVLSDLQAAPPAAAGMGSLSPTQISMTLYLSRLAMARLVVYRSPSIALQYYLDAIQGRWQIDPADFQSIFEIVSTGTVVQLLDHCHQFLSTHPKTEKMMIAAPAVTPTTSTTDSTVSVAKKAADPNLKLLTILVEGASMLSQSSPAPTPSSSTGSSDNRKIHGEVALALFAMAAALTRAAAGTSNDDDTMSGVVVILRNMAAVYKHLRIPYSASACLIRIGELVVATPCAQQDKRPEGDNTLLSWDLFQALLLAMETGDFVRMQRATELLGRCNAIVFQDVQTVVEVARAVISQDNEYLHNNASYALEHLMLMVQDGGEDAKDQLLLCQHVTPIVSIDTLTRVQRLAT
ncbi:hypothetical protein EDD21DRAFT_147340 [Dissophora ornata]|nr:hypothetical protein EDD21DRAFT_147340 [Dissophora ornata]